MKDARIIITGGAGFIGSTLAKKLTETSNKVTVIDDLSTGKYQNIKNLDKSGKLNFIKGTITDINFLNKNFEDIDYVFHLAAIASVPKSIKDPITTNNVNLNGTLNVLMASRKNNIKKVVFASSSSVYGDTKAIPIKEDIIPKPLSPYAVSKLTGENYCNAFTEVYGIPTISLRYFNVFGPRQDPLSDYAAVIPIFINKSLNNESLIIHGDGEQIRDFIFVDDVVNVNIKAAKSKVTGVFNIASGKRTTINKLAEVVMKICKNKLDLKYVDTRPGDIKLSLADISKAEKKLNFIPNFSLKDGLKETVKWFQTQNINTK